MKKILITVLMVISFVSNAQEFKIPKITEADFKETKYLKDTLASAVVEYNIGKSYFEPAGQRYQVTTIKKTRIKILTKEGYNYATVKVPLYRDRATREYLTISDAYTYNLVDDKIEKTKLKGDGEFIEKIEGNHYLATFTMPNVKEGSIIEYTTKVTSPYFTYITDWYFQLEIPVKYSEFRLVIPNFLIFYKYVKGFEKVNQSIVGDEYIYKASDLPALRDEGFVTNIYNYRSAVIHKFSGYKEKNGTTKNVAGNWDDVVKTIYDNENFGKQLKNAQSFQKTADDIIKKFNSVEDKADAIHSYVRDNIKFNGDLSKFTTQSINSTLKNKTGNSADLNLLTICLMKSVGIEAYPVLISTRGNGIAYMPSADAFNNVIIGVENFGKTFLYDATNKFTSRNILSINNINWIGRLVRDNGSSKDVLIDPTIVSRNGISATLKLNLQNGSVHSKIRRSFSNYDAFVIRNRYDNLTKDKIVDHLKEIFNTDIDNYEVNNLDVLTENVEEVFEFNRNNSFDIIGNKIYLTPTFIFGMNQNPFKADVRKYPVDFNYPKTSHISINYEIPEGYEVDYIPKSKKISTKSQSINVTLAVSNDNKLIKIRYNLDINVTYADANEYHNIKQLYEDILKFQDEKIVLKKIN